MLSKLNHNLLRGSKTFLQSAMASSMSKDSKSLTSLVLGVYESNKIEGTPSFQVYDDQFDGALSKVLKKSCLKPLKPGKVRAFYPDAEDIDCVFLVGIGKKDDGVDKVEKIDFSLENVREGIAAGIRAAKEHRYERVLVDTCHAEKASAEAAILSNYAFTQLKTKKDEMPVNLHIEPCITEESNKISDVELDVIEWKQGAIYGEAQNFARMLTETPANHMTPTIFSEIVSEELLKTGSNIKVITHDRKWAEEMKMFSFLSVSNGSDQPPKFLEIEYNGAKDKNQKPIAFVGKGVTFDSGGISLKPPPKMDRMRGDMGGAAVCVSTIWAASKLQLPINLVGLIPLTENMPNGKATKPGDVVTAMNGMTIQIDNTDAEGRLILADALCYSAKFEPRLIIDMATLTGAIGVALGGGAAGVYTNTDECFYQLQKASVLTGDRVWQMPLFNIYQRQMKSHLADVNNLAACKPAGGSCTAAGFLRNFVPKNTKWMHCDIAGVMENSDEVSWLCKGMTGRPTRTMVQFLRDYQDYDCGDNSEQVKTRQAY